MNSDQQSLAFALRNAYPDVRIIASRMSRGQPYLSQQAGKADLLAAGIQISDYYVKHLSGSPCVALRNRSTQVVSAVGMGRFPICSRNSRKPRAPTANEACLLRDS